MEHLLFLVEKQLYWWGCCGERFELGNLGASIFVDVCLWSKLVGYFFGDDLKMKIDQLHNFWQYHWHIIGIVRIWKIQELQKTYMFLSGVKF